jgi:plasmid segregation protein ParM
MKPADNPLKTIHTDTLAAGTLFVSPDGVLYQVVTAGSIGFRKAERWPPHDRSVAAKESRTVALVPGSLPARRHPVVAEGTLLPRMKWADFTGPGRQPSHYTFPKEELARLAAWLDQTLAHPSGLGARKEHARWILSDGQDTFRVYHYQFDSQEEEIDLSTRFAEEHIEALACYQGPHYWQYIPGWEETLSASTRYTEFSLESAIEAVIAETAEAVAEHETMGVEPAAPAAAAVVAPVAEEQPTTPGPPEPETETVLTEEEITQPRDTFEHALQSKTKTSRRRTSMMILSVDIGYGYTKGIGPDGLRFSFPSVIGTAEDIRFAADLIRGGEERPVKYGDWRFFYGEQAVLQSRIQSTIFDRSRVHDNTYKMLFVAALVELAKLVPGTESIKVVTGLPVEFFGDRPEVVKTFEGVYRINADGTIKFTVESVVVAPQPFGSLFQELLNEHGKIVSDSLEKGRVGIIDVGTYTTDFVVSDALRYVQRLSGSIRIGWSKVISQVQQELGDQHMLELTLHEVDRAVQAKEVRVRGELVSLESLIAPAITDVQTAIIARARDLWGQGTNLDAVLVSGGGGPYLYDAIHDVYPHARLLNDAFWANAEGLYRFGQRPATFEK